jgi:hypothetical protein
MRCPSCGWSNTLKNYPKKIQQLKKNIDDTVLDNLQRLFLTTLDDLTSYTLLKSCEDIDEEVLKYCINIWERKKLEEKGFDVYYFIGIIRNENKRFESKAKMEQKRLEGLPPDLG